MQLYRDIFKRSWTITHKHKSLWWFGFFAILWGGKSVDFELFFTNAQLLTSGLSPFNPGFWQLDQWSQIFTVLTGSPTPILLLGLFLVLFVVLIAIIIISHIGLIDAFGTYGSTRKRSEYQLADAIHASDHHFFAVLGTSVLAKVISYGLFVLVALPVFFVETSTVRLLTTLALFFVVAPLSVVVSLIAKYAVNAIILDDVSAHEGIKKAWNIFHKNIGISLEMALIMMLVFLSVNIGAMVFGVVATLPVGVFVQMIFEPELATFLYYLVSSSVVFCAVVGSSVLFSTWHFGSWTLLFQELTKAPKKAKLHRVLKGEEK